MSKKQDVIIIGAGHNGLTAAGFLAKAGLKVLVLEQREILGGIAATEELIPGFHFNTGFPTAEVLLNEVVQGLNLANHGFEILNPKVSRTLLLGHGSALTLPNGTAYGIESNATIPERDRAAYPKFLEFLERSASILAAMAPLTPPDLKKTRKVQDIFPWAKIALQVKRYGDREMTEFLRSIPMSVREVLDEWFESPALKALIGIQAVNAIMLGPMGPGSFLNLILSTRPAAQQYVRGGIGKLSEALADAARSYGAEIRMGQKVVRIALSNGRVTGIETAIGDHLEAETIISSIDPVQSYFDLIGPQYLPVETLRRIENIRLQGSTATVHLALRALPDFGLEPEQLSGALVFCPDLEYLERAFDDAKYGWLSKKPGLVAHIPTITDPSLAPEGKHTLSVIVRYAPYSLREGSWDELRDSLSHRVIEILSRAAPFISEVIEGVAVITPLDYQDRYRLSEGAWTHGQMGLDQFWVMRPIPGWAGYRTPIEGFFLGGSGTHPGGGVTAAPDLMSPAKSFGVNSCHSHLPKSPALCYTSRRNSHRMPAANFPLPEIQIRRGQTRGKEVQPNMRDYEVVYVVHPDLEETAFTEIVERVSGWITEAGGTVSKVDLWGKRDLAYPILKKKEGQYVLLETQMAPSFCSELERNMRFLEPVMRFLITRPNS